MIEIVAELGVNFKSLDEAKQMITSAKAAGADSAKLQIFLPEHVRNHPHAAQLVQTAMIAGEQFGPLMEHAAKDEIELFATPFTPAAVDFLEEYKVKKYKIRHKDALCLMAENGSAVRVTPSPLIERVLATGKPVYISVSRKPLDPYFLYHPRISYLYCDPHYPSRVEDLELWCCAYGFGLSCHSPDPMVPIAAASMMLSRRKHNEKARSAIIEVHVSNEPKSEYPDGNVSFNFDELAHIVKSIRKMEEMRLEPPYS